MRKLALTLVLALVGCSGGSGVWSPSDPTSFDRSMFDRSAIEALPAEERPYVMGHAIGVYLYGKTLPGYVAGHYLYRPGKSSPHAEIAYDWEDLLVARSGGSDGQGGAIFDDVSADPQHDPEGNDMGGDDVEPDQGDCGEIDVRCGTFLDPAAVDARELARLVDASRFADPGLTGAELSRFAQEFQRGLDAALAMADAGEWAGHSEVTYVWDAAIAYGLCQQ